MKIKKIIKSIIALSIVTILIIPCDIYAIENEAVSLFTHLSYKNPQINDEIYELVNDSKLGLSNKNITDFGELLSCSKESHDFKEKYSFKSEKKFVTVQYDETNKIRVMLKVDDDITLYVNDMTYNIFEKDDDIYLKNEKGDTLLIADYTNLNTNSNYSIMASNGAYSLPNDNEYSTDYGPFKKTGVYLVSIISFISDISSYYVEHPILGKIYVASTFANIVLSQSGYLTSYIKYWQSFSKSDSTYVREKQKWYNSSSYSSSSFIKNHTRYYYNTRPGY